MTEQSLVNALRSLGVRTAETDLAVADYLRHRANDAIDAEKVGRTIIDADYHRANDLRRAAAQLEGSPWPPEKA